MLEVEVIALIVAQVADLADEAATSRRRPRPGTPFAGDGWWVLAQEVSHHSAQRDLRFSPL